jgi:Flp pilus assembly pilin Flp
MLDKKNYPGSRASKSGGESASRRCRSLAGAQGGKAWRTFEGRRLMDSKSKEHALEYALILGVGALLLVLVFVNIHSRIFA